MYFDRVKYSATQTTASSFSVTLSTGFQALPTTATSVKLHAVDSAGKYAYFDGYRSGSNILVNYVTESSETGDTMPTFGSGIEVFSSVGAASLNDGQLGSGAIICWGQSNGYSSEASSADAEVDFIDGRVTQWKHTDGSDRIVQAVNYLDYKRVGLFPFADSLAWPIVFAKDYIKKEACNNICILPMAVGSTGFVTNEWNSGDVYYTAMITAANQFLAENENNYIIGVFGNIGENDATYGGEAAFAANLSLFVDNVKGDLVGNQRHSDFTRLPFVNAGMTDAYKASTAAYITVQAALEDLPNQVAYTGFLDCTGYTTYSPDIHFDGEGHRSMGNNFYPELVSARGNVGVTALAATVTATATVTGLIPADTNMTASITATGTLSGALAAPSEFSANISATASVTGAIVETITMAAAVTGTASAVVSAMGDSSSTPLTDALGPIMQLVNGVGVTTVSTKVSEWADQSGNGNHATQTVDAKRPDLVASEIDFPGAAAWMDLPAATYLTVEEEGNTFIIDFTPHSTAAGSSLLFSSDGHYFNANQFVRTGTTADNDIIPTGIPLTASTRYTMAIRIDAVGDSIKVYRDDVSVGTEATPSWASLGTGVSNRLGQWSAFSLTGFDGVIHNHTVFDKLLTESEVTDVLSEYS